MHDMFREAFGSKRSHLEPEGKEQARVYIRKFLENLADQNENRQLEEQAFHRLVGDRNTTATWVS